MNAAIRVAGVRYSYPDAVRPALDGIDVDVAEGELVLLLGESGCGKSTLLRALLGLVPHFHGGQLAGRIVSAGLDTRDHRPAGIARRVGLVFQDPESQLVMRRVDHEVAFGLENLGCPANEIAARTEQALLAVGAAHLAGRETGTLSGGEQQRVAIASVLAMGQRILLLDEPTSQLDPAAAEELLGLVQRLNRDRGITVVIAEHRTARIFAEADRVIAMEAGRIAVDAPPDQAADQLAGPWPWLLPPVTQAFIAAHRAERPLTVRDARRLAPAPPPAGPHAPSQPEPLLRLERIDAVRGGTMALRKATTGFAGGRVTAVVGANGAGKTTLAHIAAGLAAPDGGHVTGPPIRGYVSQNPAHHAIRETTGDEVAYALENIGVRPQERSTRVAEELERFGLADLAARHPADLSIGERQRLAIASVTVVRPQALFLDEPTRGIDGLRSLAVAELVRSLASDGCAVAVVTHDLDFAGEVADEVTTLALGTVLADRQPASQLAADGLFACQLGLALGCRSIAQAAAVLRAELERARV